ncbi:hypothetical protein DENIS_0366 [Desulfonema ishimotonii]|uniref:Uncharacterized protein n=1 Tax=Desulfonema ishimotonii TaxID=45657 RepID=A0A401FR34_9BACT|nr:hypothetical protein [Desulfonema ishimotonii]GBC59427.1 hypothetical protein DENIS_0366 [Desulfonema ishimotonii]
MIHFDPVPEPHDFDKKAKQPGLRWIEKHPDAKRPKDFWTPFKPCLTEGFAHLCAYSALFEPVGTVDHYISVRTDMRLAYEWNNYRFASAWMNSSKQTADDRILDPFEVEDGWFEIILPSLQLVMTDSVPEEYMEKARFTLKRLHLQDDERIIRIRQEWYRMYLEHEITLEGLKRKAPLIARAIEKQQKETIP